MLIPRFVVSMFTIAMMVLGAGVASGQTTSTGSGQAYPDKPIRVVTGGIGGGSDFAARLIAQGISVPLGQPVIVDNRASGVIPGEIVSKAPPDGYTLLVVGSTFTIGSLLRKTPYDPVRDFAPISIVGKSLDVLYVHPSLPVKSVKELIALAKSKPGELNIALVGVGGSSHLAAELFKSMASVNIVAVPYATESQMITDLIGGRVQLLFTTPSTLMAQVKLGKLTALAVASTQPSALVPGLPTVTASGLPGFESGSQSIIYTSANTPEAIIKRLNQEIVRLLGTPEVRERFLNTGVEVVGSSPGEAAAFIKSDMAKWGKVIKDAGIKVN